MKSFWTSINNGLLFFSLLLSIVILIVVASSYKDVLSNEMLIGIIILGINFILMVHSFWGMIVEMSKNVINGGDLPDLISKESKRISKENEQLKVKIDEMSTKLSLLTAMMANNPGENKQREVNIPQGLIISDEEFIPQEVDATPMENEGGKKIGWYCSSCMYGNSNENKFCERCGNPRMFS